MWQNSTLLGSPPCSPHRQQLKIYVIQERGFLIAALCGGQAGDGNTVGRAADVVQANVVAELDTAGIAAVLAAQAAIKNLRDSRTWIFNCCLCGGQAGDGNTVGRAADVVQANVVAELDTAGIAAVLAARSN